MAEPEQPGPAQAGTPPPPEKRMTFMGHLLELRRRLMVVMASLVVTMVLSLVFYEPLFAFLKAPLDRVNRLFLVDPEYQQLLRDRHLDPTQDVVHPITTDPLGLLTILMKVSLWAGLLLASPVIVYEIWGFVAPGLRPQEKRAIRPVFWAGIGFFLAGAAFCYYIVFPYTIEFLVWFDVNLGYQPSYPPAEYIGLLLTFMLIFGAVCEIPLVVAILARLGLVKPQWLVRPWRYIIVVIFFLGAVLSPGTDMVSSLLLSGALLFLYVLSIGMAFFFYAKRKAGP